MIERIEILHHLATTKDIRKYKLINYRTPKQINELRTTLQF